MITFIHPGGRKSLYIIHSGGAEYLGAGSWRGAQIRAGEWPSADRRRPHCGADLCVAQHRSTDGSWWSWWSPCVAWRDWLCAHLCSEECAMHSPKVDVKRLQCRSSRQVVKDTLHPLAWLMWRVDKCWDWSQPSSTLTLRWPTRMWCKETRQFLFASDLTPDAYIDMEIPSIENSTSNQEHLGWKYIWWF